jgi:O-antigen/teichoic acid export membrane protein
VVRSKGLVARGVRFARRALLPTGIDQALSSVSNFLVVVAVGRVGGTNALGSYTIAFAAYTLVLGFQRALISRPQMALSGTPSSTRDWPLATGISLLFGALGGVILAGAGLVVRSKDLVIIGIGMPFLLLQDQLRYLLFKSNRYWFAAATDGIWVLVVAASLPIAIKSGHAFLAVGAWCLGAAASAVFAMAASRIHPSPVGSLSWWWSECRTLGLALAAESTIYSITIQGTILIAGAVLGQASLGELKGAQALFAPIGLLLGGIGFLVLPRFADRRTRRSLGGWTAFAGSGSLIGIIAIAAWSSVLAPLIFGASFDFNLGLVAPVAMVTLMNGVAQVSTAYLTAAGRGGYIAASRLASGSVALAIALAAMPKYGIYGVAWAMSVQAIAYASLTAIKAFTLRD